MEYHFGEFTLDTALGRLTGPDGDIVLRRQSWRLLVELLEQAPALIERDELLDRVWGRNALSPNALPQTISELRQALGDSARKPRYIETCHGRGYRLVCEVESRETGPDQPTVADGPPAGAANIALPPTRWPLMAGAVVTVIVMAGVVLWSPEPSGDTSASGIEQESRVDSLKRQAEVALERNDPESAAAHLRALVLMEPDNVEWALAQAEAELDALQGDNARRSLALLASQPDTRQDPRLLTLQSRLAMVDGDFEQADYLAEAARIQAHSLGQSAWVAEATRVLSRARQRRGELELAAEALTATLDDRSLEFDRSERFALSLELAMLRRDQGRLDDARTAFEQAAAVGHDGASAYRLRVEQALLMAAAGEPDSAWQKLQNLQAEWPKRAGSENTLALYSALGQLAVEVGQIDQALAAYEQAFALARSSGKAYQVAGMQINIGSLMARHDRFEEAEGLWNAALETFERIGDRRGQAIALGNLAAVASAQGHNTRSQSLNRQALEIFRDLGLDGPRARTAFNLALVASREGRLDEAESLLAEAQAGYENTGNNDLALHVGAVRIDHRVLAGDLVLAEALLDELESRAESGSSLRRAAVLASRGRLEKWRGNLDGARLAFEQALALRTQSGQQGWIATSELELLQVALLNGDDPWRVRVQAGELAETFDHSGQSRAAARARLVAAEALLSQGEVVEAREELKSIRARHGDFTDISLALDLAWVEAWAAREEERLPRLESLARRAHEHGYFGKLVQIEAGLAARGLLTDSLVAIRSHESSSDSRMVVALLPPYAARPIEVNSPE